MTSRRAPWPPTEGSIGSEDDAAVAHSGPSPGADPAPNGLALTKEKLQAYYALQAALLGAPSPPRRGRPPPLPEAGPAWAPPPGYGPVPEPRTTARRPKEARSVSPSQSRTGPVKLPPILQPQAQSYKRRQQVEHIALENATLERRLQQVKSSRYLTAPRHALPQTLGDRRPAPRSAQRPNWQD